MNVAIAFDYQHIEPPRIAQSRDVCDAVVWVTAQGWVERHLALVRQVGGGLAAAAFPSEDLFQEALLVAFDTLSALLAQGAVDQFVPRFSRNFRLRVRTLVRRGLLLQTELRDDFDDVAGSLPNAEESWLAQENHRRQEQGMRKGLGRMTRRQAAAWQVYCQFPCLRDASLHLGLSEKKLSALLNRGLTRARGVA
ncbi:hypothetical protein [Geoalkalibacter sp.]|uniref:hypothetical protein n=1 Tax=Geoalkalibacter sp. TaxID=3041440 RepID=UPI00272E155E|nr:hypothetical protein [Geoalkalibacter sp.]